MALSKGRVVRGDGGVTIQVGDTVTVQAQGRVVTRRLVEAERDGIRLVEEAKVEAARLVGEARLAMTTAREDAEKEGKATGTAALAAHWAKTRADEAQALAAAENKVIDVARALAERLLGRELIVSPETVVHLARVALAGATRARRVVIKAHPDDVVALRAASLGEVVDGKAVEIVVDESRGLGCLRIETDIGVLDGDLAPQLDRLVAALRGP